VNVKKTYFGAGENGEAKRGEAKSNDKEEVLILLSSGKQTVV
jgi:hypothetical protein